MAEADGEAEFEGHKADLASVGKEHMAVLKYISLLHAECDWLFQYHEESAEW